MQTMPHLLEPETIARLKKILVPVDFSLPSQQALDYARSFARCFEGEIILLHAVPRMTAAPYPEVPGFVATIQKEELKDAEHNLQALAMGDSPDDPVKLRTLVRNGLPAHEIVEAAKELDADLIVIATHGYTGWKHFCIGSTTERVVRTAPCPVFVIREKEHEFA